MFEYTLNKGNAATENSVKISNTLTINRTVPSNFLGLTAHRWPVGPTTESPVGALPYTIVRSHDSDVTVDGTVYDLQWRNIHTANETYDWSKMDLWVNAHYANNTEICFTIFGTPAWASARPTEANPGYPAYLGGLAEPSSPGVLYDFVTAIHTRYGTKIKYFEVWNEPSWNPTTGVADGHYFTGTADKLGEMVRIVKQTLLANSSLAKVISSPPASAGDSNNYGRLLNGTVGEVIISGAYPALGKTWNYVDIVGVHSYHTAYTGDIFRQITELKAYLATLKTTIPDVITTSTSSTSVTGGASAAFTTTLVRDNKLYTSAGVYLGEIASITNDTTAVLKANALAAITSQAGAYTSVVDAPIWSTEVGWLEALGTEIDQDYIDTITALIAESVLAGCDRVFFYSWDQALMGINTKPDVISNISRVWEALRGQTFTSVTIKPSDYILEVH